MIPTTNRYISKDPAILGGEPIISGTRTPVRAIVELWRSGMAPEEIPTSLPHLTLAQVFDALSYYSDNQKEIEQLIVQNRVSSQYDSPEHNRLGRSGTELAATVWDHEDFSDWEK